MSGAAYVRLQALRAEYGSADPEERTPEGQLAWLLSVFAPMDEGDAPPHPPLDGNLYVYTQDGYRVATPAEIEAAHLDAAPVRPAKTSAELAERLQQTHITPDDARGVIPAPEPPYRCTVPMCGESGVCEECRKRGAR